MVTVKQKISIFAIIVAVLFLAVYALPASYWEKIGMSQPGFAQKAYNKSLDLAGGVHLIWQADMTNIAQEQQRSAMDSLKSVIERRVNLFGVQEPVVQIQGGIGNWRLVVDLAGITDPQTAINMVGQTPYLEFRVMRSDAEISRLQASPTTDEKAAIAADPLFIYYEPSQLTGRYLQSSQLEFDQTTGKPYVGLNFNTEGAKIFAGLTGDNVGKNIAIILDGQVIEAPKVNEAITGGSAQIEGTFTIKQAKALVTNLNAGALPVPISLISQQTVGPTLGKSALNGAMTASFWALMIIFVFLIAIYRFSGVIAFISLLFYSALLLSVFKFLGVSMSLAGIAGLLLSIGMAVDANILILERLREELKEEQALSSALKNAYHRAWPAIRDGNATTLIICFILFLMASGFVRGFSVTLILGLLISMLAAMIVSKQLSVPFAQTSLSKHHWLWTR